jgi:hypothetical protein
MPLIHEQVQASSVARTTCRGNLPRALNSEAVTGSSPQDRRAVLGGAATAAALLVGVAAGASSSLVVPGLAMAATSGSEGEFQTAPNGLAWKETAVGSGPAPVRGSLIRYGGRFGVARDPIHRA